MLILRMSSERSVSEPLFGKSFHASRSSAKRSHLGPRFALALTDLFIVLFRASWPREHK